MNRREFLRSFSALAAAAVAGPTLARLAATDIERITQAMLAGVVRDQSFYFKHPIVLELPRLIITRCCFVFEFDGDEAAIHIADTAHHLTIENCIFELRGARGPAVLIEPRSDGGDMTDTFQSVMNLNITSSPATIALAAGTYEIDQLAIPDDSGITITGDSSDGISE